MGCRDQRQLSLRPPLLHMLSWPVPLELYPPPRGDTGFQGGPSLRPCPETPPSCHSSGPCPHHPAPARASTCQAPTSELLGAQCTLVLRGTGHPGSEGPPVWQELPPGVSHKGETEGKADMRGQGCGAGGPEWGTQEQRPGSISEGFFYCDGGHGQRSRAQTLAGRTEQQQRWGWQAPSGRVALWLALGAPWAPALCGQAGAGELCRAGIPQGLPPGPPGLRPLHLADGAQRLGEGLQLVLDTL